MFSSVAGAAEHQGHRLGEFVEAGEYNGRPFYKQRDTEGTSSLPGNEDMFLYYSEHYSDGWWVSGTLGGSTGSLYNDQNTSLPMRSNWLYWDGKKWNNNDTSLTLEFTSLSPCKLVRVVGGEDVVEKVGSSLGDYRFAFHCA